MFPEIKVVNLQDKHSDIPWDWSGKFMRKKTQIFLEINVVNLREKSKIFRKIKVVNLQEKTTHSLRLKW